MNISPRSLKTQLKTAQANSATQAWQILNHTPKTNNKPMDEKEHRNHNSTYLKGVVLYSKDNFVVNQTLNFQMKYCGKSPLPLRVAAKRYWLFYDNTANIELTTQNGQYK